MVCGLRLSARRTRARHCRRPRRTGSSPLAPLAGKLREIQRCGGPRVRLGDLRHVLERIAIVRLGLRRHAIARYYESVVAHVGVVRGEEHAEVGGHTGHDDGARAKMLEQNVERSELEPGVLGLEDEVVVLAWL